MLYTVCVYTSASCSGQWLRVMCVHQYTHQLVQDKHYQRKLQVMPSSSASKAFALIDGRKTPPAQVAQGQDHLVHQQEQDAAKNCRSPGARFCQGQSLNNLLAKHKCQPRIDRLPAVLDVPSDSLQKNITDCYTYNIHFAYIQYILHVYMLTLMYFVQPFILSTLGTQGKQDMFI